MGAMKYKAPSFVGREAELAWLSELWDKEVASLVTCRGRRRVGKSTLIAEFANRTADRFLRFEGLPPRPGIDDAAQRKSFCADLSAQSALPNVCVGTWSEAFALLDSVLPNSGRTVVLLDEVSWLGGYDPDFAGYLKKAWDRMFSQRHNLVFVLCGSVSAWIVENILKNTGFAGRNSLDLEVPELPLRDCERFFGKNASRIDIGEKLDLLSVTGGVPRYLQEIRPSSSANENIRRLCFTPGGLLFREFDEIFADIFGEKSIKKKAILRTLASGSKSATDIAASLGESANGHLSDVLDELRLAGFVAKDIACNPQTGRPHREARYRIKDNYTRFYLRYVEPRKAAIESGLFTFGALDRLDGWESVLGLNFENLVLNHIDELLPRIGLQGTLILSAAPYRQERTQRAEGCQIDLLVQTRRSVCIVEIKRRHDIGADVVDAVAAKVSRLRVARGTSVRTALVYEGHLSPSVREEGFFDFLVSSADLFGTAHQGGGLNGK